MQTGSDETTLLSLFLCGRRGKGCWEGRGRVWRNFVVDLPVQSPAPLPDFPLPVLPHPPGSSLPQPVGCRWDTLGSTSSSEPTQMAAGIPLGEQWQSLLVWCSQMLHLWIIHLFLNQYGKLVVLFLPIKVQLKELSECCLILHIYLFPVETRS